MYGVPADLDLAFLRGAELVQVCLGSFQVQFHFHPTGSILVGGGWELVDGAGERLDQSYDTPARPPYQLHRLIGRVVAGIEVSAPAWFALRFDDGTVLRVFDDMEGHESFQILPTWVVV